MNWTGLPLDADGRSLVEASAGTGKTWTIAVLYLRLLLERGLSPRRIIVSTFTNAAAAELGERLRSKLLWALAEAEQCRSGLAVDDQMPSDRQWIRNRWLDDGSLLDRDVQRLQAALAEFDAAPIATLHSLCSRILIDHPFAAGALFRGRDMIDGKTLEAALVDDLWRVIAQGEAGDPLVRLAQAAEIERKDLLRYVPLLLQPDVVVGGLDPVAFRDQFGFLGDPDAWAAQVRQLVGQEALFNKACTLRQAWSDVAAAIESPQGNLRKATSRVRTLADAGKMNGISAAGKRSAEIRALVEQSPAIASTLAGFGELDLDLSESIELRRFLAAAQVWGRQAMQSRLDAANQSTFDQLLHTVRDALQPRDGQRALADALFAAWPVALVDEFQDTDPVQFAILDAIYKDASAAPRGRLVMIGDPKQAIYRFRGGDVQAYERAKAAVPQEARLSLAVNHRSSRAYVSAINEFYLRSSSKLGPAESDTGIHYAKVQASARRDEAPLRAAENGEAITRPLVLHEISADELAEDTPAQELEAYALDVCAGQIVSALSGKGYRIGDRRLQPGDIAVLLPSHRQIARLMTLLKLRGVPCVVSSQKSVFESDTARDLRLVLHAALHPEDGAAVRAALATRLCGVGLRELQALRHDASAWERHVARFHTLRETLDRRGPLAVASSLLDEHAVRWMQCVEGERMLTDLRHLGELLQETWVDCGGGERLAAWFARQMDEGGEDADAADARALRLESDADRVKLMTLHASKGLEFGLVFLPLMWKHAGASRGASLLASNDGACKYLVEGRAKEIVKRQEYEERFRVLYVALTRAIHACHVLVVPPQARAKLKRSLGKVALNAIELDLPRTSTDATESAIALVQGWDAGPRSGWLAETASGSERAARPLPAEPVGPLPMRHSFSGLTRGARQRVAEEDGAAEDEALVEQSPGEQADPPDDAAVAPASEVGMAHFHPDLDALSPLIGADFGNAVHALFEHRAPQQPITPEASLAALREHGVGPREGELEALAAKLADRLNGVLKTELGAVGGPSLWQLKASDMRAEMEFNYLLDGVSLGELRKACERHGEPGLVPRREQTLAGLMNGKIDLLFSHGGRIHVLDYKGNQLASGPRACLQDYAPAALAAKMASTGYRFQALLYTVAVERYLRERLGDDYRRGVHLGDCWYLFIRAVGLSLPDGTPCGVWRHRFDDALLDAVQAALGAARREAA